MMTASNIAMHFNVQASDLDAPETWKKIRGIGELVIGKLAEDATEIQLGSHNDKLIIFHNSAGSHASVRVYSHGLVTVDIQHLNLVESLDETKFSAPLIETYIRSLEDQVKNHLERRTIEFNTIHVPIRRGGAVWPYFTSSDDRARLIESDVDRLVFEKDSAFQNIRIYHSMQAGNSLFLDMEPMLSEGDADVYNHTLLNLPEENFTGKTVLILGGGDGGLLHELLKHNPAYVTMAEIDIEVIKGCRTHMRSVCGSDMDELEGPNYKIVIGDCLEVLQKAIETGNLFDYVINDLTEFPVDKPNTGFGYDFKTTSLITELSIRAKKPGGKVFGRGNGIGAKQYLGKLEADIRALDHQYKRKERYINIFQEIYIFYEIWQ